MTSKNWIEQLTKDEIMILVPQEHAQDALVNDLETHLINHTFDTKIIPCNAGVIVVIINQDTERRLELVGALAYYKIPGVEYQLWIEQHNGTLFTNTLFQ